MITSGFYNSLAGDRKYNSVQISRLFEGIINDGVFASIGESLMVVTSSGMTVNVGTGRAWFNNTWTDNDADIPLTLDAAEAILNRIDAIVLEVGSASDVRANTIKIVKGTPGSVPVAPTMIKTTGQYQYTLATIYVGAGVTSIVAGNITNKIGTASCPFVAVVGIDALTPIWENEFNTWFAALQAQMSGDVATNLQNQINTLDGRADALEVEVQPLDRGGTGKTTALDAIKALGFGYGTCSTAGSTTAKVGTLAGFALVAGGIIAIKFTNANTAAAPTLNVNSTGAKTIQCGGMAPKPWCITAGMTALFQYDGTYWQLLNPEEQVPKESYMAFCANVNTNSLNAAFGQNNESFMSYLGMQLAMYSWWKGASTATYPYTNLKACHTLAEVAQNQAAIDELYANANLRDLIELSPYACSVIATYGVAADRAIYNATMLAFVNASTNLKAAFQTNSNGIAAAKMAVNLAGQSYTSIADMNALIASSTVYNAVIASATAMAWIYCNECNAMKLIANQVGQAYSAITGTADFIASAPHVTALKSSGLGLKSLCMTTNVKVLTDMHTPLNADQTARGTVLATLRAATTYFNTEASVNSGHAGPSFAVPYQAQRSSGAGTSTASFTDSYGGSYSTSISGTTLYTMTADIYLLIKNSSAGVSPYGSFASVKYIAVKAGII